MCELRYNEFLQCAQCAIPIALRKAKHEMRECAKVWESEVRAWESVRECGRVRAWESEVQKCDIESERQSTKSKDKI